MYSETLQTLQRKKERVFNELKERSNEMPKLWKVESSFDVSDDVASRILSFTFCAATLKISMRWPTASQL